jgi:predicted metal-dependent hydrolase
MSSSALSEQLSVDALPVPIVIRPMRGARRLRLRFDEANGVLKLTCPWRTSRRSALAWAVEQKDWIEAQVAGARPAEPLIPGATIPLEGGEVRLAWVPAGPRVPALADGVLSCGGPEESFARRIESFLKRRALTILSQDVAEFARAAGVTARAVSVGDAGSRWGSCSSQGRIRFSWRLILASPHVRRFVAAHEVAHLVHLDHGPQFRALEARLAGPGLAQAKADLRGEAPRIRRIGRRR